MARKVTRTVVTPVIRYKQNGEPRYLLHSTASSGVMDLVKPLADAESIEAGYMPLLYSMDEKEFLAEADMETVIAKATLYPTASECPASAERKKSNEDK